MVDTSITEARLVYSRRADMGIDRAMHFSTCVLCKTEYPHLYGVPHCNGQHISQCPYCRPDSEPFKYGRGK